MKTIGLLIPCYNEEESLVLLYEKINQISKQIANYKINMLFVDDGSKDNTLDILIALSINDERIKFISFSRNFGKESAIYAGLQFIQGEYICLMDADLQHPPDEIIKMMKAMEEGYDIAASKRSNRTGEKKIYSSCAKLFYKVMNKLAQVNIDEGAQDFRMMTRKVVNSIINMPEYHRFSKGIFSWVGFKTKWLEHENVKRVAGNSKWSFYKSCLYAIEGIISFSTVPLKVSLFLGSMISITGFLYAIYILIRTLIYGSDWPGFPTITSLILIMSGIILLSLGIIGEYISKIYTEIKRRPLYIIDKTNIVMEEQ